MLTHPAEAPYLRGERATRQGGIVRHLWRPWYARYVLRYAVKGITRTGGVERAVQLARLTQRLARRRLSPPDAPAPRR